MYCIFYAQSVMDEQTDERTSERVSASSLTEMLIFHPRKSALFSRFTFDFFLPFFPHSLSFLRRFPFSTTAD
jgi:hypothetical protein